MSYLVADKTVRLNKGLSKKTNSDKIKLKVNYFNKSAKNRNTFLTHNLLSEFNPDLFLENAKIEKGNGFLAWDQNDPLLSLTQAWWTD